jgi:hypothetical protein
MFMNTSRFALTKVKHAGIALLAALTLFVMGCNNPLVQNVDSAAPEARNVGVGTATITNVSFSGIVNTPYTGSVEILLNGNYFGASVIIGADVTDWFTNPPLGPFSAVIGYVSPTLQVATIDVSGTSSVVDSFQIRVTIPESALLIPGSNITIPETAGIVYDIRWAHSAWTKSATDIFPADTGSVNAAAYGIVNNAGIFVVGNRVINYGAYSTDGGETWAMAQIFPDLPPDVDPYHISSIVFMNDLFYAGGAGGNLAFSPDGKGWTLISGDGLLDGEDIRTIVHGNGNTIIAGTNGKMSWTSGYPDSDSVWTPVAPFTTGAVGNYNHIIYGEVEDGVGLFVATGQEALSGYSEDGINWTSTTDQTDDIFPPTGSQSSIKQVAFNPKTAMFVIVGYHEAAYAYTDGAGALTDWEPVQLSDIMGTTGRTSWLNAVTFADGYFVAGGSLGQSISSNDGINWGVTGAQDEFDPTVGVPFINAITYGDGKYFLGGGDDNGPGVGVYNTN